MVPGAIHNAETAAANHFLYFKFVKTIPDRQRVQDSPIVFVIRHLKTHFLMVLRGKLTMKLALRIADAQLRKLLIVTVGG